MSIIRPLTQELQKIACTELNEKPEMITQDLENFKEWLKTQPHLRARTDHQFLLSFLRGCKYNMEKAKSKIDKYYTLKTKYPNFYTVKNVQDPKVIELCERGIGVILPMPLNCVGPRILFIRPGRYPTDKFMFSDVMCLANALQEICMLEDDYFMVCGYVQILDMSDFTAGHLLQMTPTVVKKMAIFAEDASPLRQKSIHLINAPNGIEKVFNTLKSLLPLKQQERIFVHGSNLSSLYEHIPRKYLPKEMGGENGSLEQISQQLSRDFEKYHEYFLEEQNYGVDETLRVNRSKDYDEVFGIEGTFRKLNVD